mmetsp:Transcript_57997/g.168232  ORF Transcript_57997/g.168232 Transcript_57997/m.168232 type:complete len:244 (+) Transcript_57997:84-815(+)
MAPIGRSSVKPRPIVRPVDHDHNEAGDGGFEMALNCGSHSATGQNMPTLLGIFRPLWSSEQSARPSRANGGAVGVSRELEKQFVPPSWAVDRSGRRPSARKQQAQALRAELRAEASDVVSAFCRRLGPLRAEPAVDELEALCGACRTLPAPAVARALCEQLSWSDGDMSWQPRLRAVAAMSFLLEQDEWGRDVARRAAEREAGVLEHLASDVPQCAALTRRLLERLEEVAPPGEPVGEGPPPL